MYFNRKNAEQKNWRMIKKGKHFLFGCSLVFAVGAALVAPTVKADTADTGEVETKTANSAAEASSSDEVGTYKAPAVGVSTTSPVVTENPTSSEATSAKTAKEADGVQLPSLTVVADSSALTDEEKANVVEAVKGVNPTATDVQVQADGSVVVTFADGSSANLSASQTVKVAAPAETSATQPKSRSRRAAGQERAQDRSMEGKDIKFEYKGGKKIEDGDPTQRAKIEYKQLDDYEVVNGKTVPTDPSGQGRPVLEWTVTFNEAKWDRPGAFWYFSIPKNVSDPYNVVTEYDGDTYATRTEWNNGDGNANAEGKQFIDDGSKLEDRVKLTTGAGEYDKVPGLNGVMANSKKLYVLQTNIYSGVRKFTVRYRTVVEDPSKTISYIAGVQAAKNLKMHNWYAISGKYDKELVSAVATPNVTPNLTNTSVNVPVQTVASTSNTLSGTGTPGATIKLYIDGQEQNIGNVTVDSSGNWTTGELPTALNNNQGDGTTIKPRQIVQVSQTVNGTESSRRTVPVSVGVTTVEPSSLTTNQDAVVAGQKEVTLKVPHDAGIAYMRYTNTAGETVEIPVKRDNASSAWTSQKSDKATVKSVENGKFQDTIVLTMADKIAGTEVSAISNVVEGGFSSVAGWQPRSVENQAPTIASAVEGNKKTVAQGAQLDLASLVTVADKEDDAQATLGDKVHAEVVSVNGDTATKTVDTNTPGTYTVKYKAVDSQGKKSDEIEVTVVVNPARQNEAPTVSIPYSDPAPNKKEVYLYTGEDADVDITFNDDSGKIKSASLKKGGNIALNNVDGNPDKQDNEWGYTVTAINSETATPATIKVTGRVSGLDESRLPKTENDSLELVTRFATATDTDGAEISNHATKDKNNAGEIVGSYLTDPGAVTFVLKAQTKKYDIKTPSEADKVTVSNANNVTDKEFEKIKEKVKVEYSQNNPDARLADKKGKEVEDASKVVDKVEKEGNKVVVTYKDGSKDTKPLSEFVNVAPTVEVPYSNQAKKEIYVYTGENTDLTFKGSDEAEVKNLYLRGPGDTTWNNAAGYGLPTGKVENGAVTGEGSVSGDKKTATIKMTGVTNLKAGQKWTSFVVAEDNNDAPSNTDFRALDKNPNATQTPGYVLFIVKSQTDKYDIATPAPADKVEVADPTNVTNDDLAKIKEKLQLEYKKDNDDANIKKDTAVDKNGKIQSVTKDGNNLVVTYTDGSTDKKPLSEFVTKAKPSKPVVETDLTGKAGTKTPVVVSAEPGTKVELFDKDGKKIGEGTADTNGKVTITPTVDIPAGNVTAKATDPSGKVSDPSDAATATTPSTPAKPSKPVVETDLTGKAGTKTPVVVSAEPGTKVELFDKDGKKIGEGTADTNGKVTITPTVDIPAGNVTAKATDPSGKVSDPSDAATATTPSTPAKPSKPVVETDLTGKAGTKTPVVVSAEPGTKVELFDKDGNKIGEGTADTNGKVTITPTVDIPAGNVTAKATDPSGKVSDPSDAATATTATTPAKPSKPVVATDLTGKAGTKTPVEVSAEPGSKVELFDKDGNKIGEGTADTNGKATITPTVDIPAGNVTAKATDPSGKVSDPSDAATATTPTTPAKPSKPVVATDLTGKAGTKTPVVVSAEPGTKVELFDKDGKKIGEGTADTTGKVTITPTVDIPAGNVTAKATKDGQTSDASKPKEATAPTPTTPTQPEITTDLTGKAGTKTPVEVTAEPGTKVELFDKDGNKIGEDTADNNGKAKITPTVDIPAGNVTAKATKDGQTSDASKPKEATAPTPTTPTQPEITTDLTGKAGTKTPVEVTAEPGTKVELFDKDGNKIGEDTADNNGKAKITPTVDIPAGNVTAKATKDGQTSDASKPKEATAPTPTTPTQPEITTDLTGKAGTKTPVEVTAEPGTKVELFDKDGNKIGEDTADNNGKAKITPTVDIPAGNVTAKATKDGQTSDASKPKEATAPTPTTPTQPEITTDLTGKAGTKTPVEVTAEPGTKVELFDKDGNKIGEDTADNNGKAKITPTVDIPAGNVTAKATKDGQTSDASAPKEATAATPAKPSKPVVATDLTGKAGTKTPVEVTAEPGSHVELFDKDGNKIGEGTADTNGKVTITPTVDIPAGNVTAKVTKDGQTSDASAPKEATAATPAKPSKPVVATDLTGKAGTKTPVEVTAEPGSHVELFDKDGKKIGEGTADTTGKVTITPTVDIPAGNVTAKATDPSGKVSDPSDAATATTPSTPSTPAKPSKPVVETDLTGKAGTKTPVEVTAEPGSHVELFDKDGKKIGEGTADTTGKVTITPTVDIPAGNVTAKATDPSGKVSDPSDVAKATTPAKDADGVKDPAKTPVKDPANLTDEEKAKVADEVKKANPTAKDVEVGKDGTATVTFPDGSKAEIPTAKTVEKSADKAVKDPSVTPVTDPSNLTDAEKAKVADEVKKSNPTAKDVEVGKDGTTTVTYPDGTTAVIPADKTVKKSADKAVKDPSVTPVTDPSNLTDAEKAKVADEVKKSNPTAKDVEVGKDGTTTVTYPDGTTAVIPADKTVKKSADKAVKDPSVTPVTDPSNLTDAEKAKVADEVKKSNPTAKDVEVGKDGTTTVTYPDGTTAVIPADKTVKKSADKAVKDPSVTPVTDPSNLTDAEKAKVADEVKKSNPTAKDVEVGKDGTTTVTYPDGTTAVIPADKTVKKSADKAVKDPSVTPVTDPSNLTDAEKAKVAEEVKKSNPTVTDVKVDKDGTTTVTYPDGTTAVVPADKTVKKSADKAVKDPSVTPVTDPSNLTDAEKAKVSDEVKKSNPTVTDVKVDKDGTTTVTYPDGTTAVIPANKTVKRSVDKAVKDPAVTPVTNPSNLTDAEKAKVADEVKKSNPTVTDVKVDKDGTTTVTYPDGTTAVVPADKTVKKSADKAVKDPSVTPVTDPSNLTDAEKAKVSDEVKKSNPTVTDVKVDKDGTTTVTYPDGTTAVIPADKTVKKSDDKGTKDPSVTPVTDPSNLTDAEKAKVAEEVKKSNPTVTDVKVDKDGTTTVTYPDGTTAVIPADKTVKKSDDKVVTDPSVTPVTDPSNLTDAEKAKVADEVKKSNPTVSKVEVGNDGTTTVTYPDGTTAVIPADKTVKKSDDKVVTDPSVTPVTDPSNLTDAEKAKVADEVKKSNPTAKDVEVGKDGTTTVTYPDGTTAVIPADKTVKKSDDKAVKDPSVTPVTDPSNLTDAEKAKVADEVKKSNPTAKDVEVGKDGTTTVTYPDGTTAVIPADKTVKKSADKVLKDSTVTPVTEPSNLTDAEKAKVADEVKKANPTVTDVKVGKDGTTTVTYPDGTTAVIPADKTVKKSADKAVKDPSVTPVTDPNNLTDAEKAKVADEVKKSNPTVSKVEVGKDGTTTVTYPDGTTAVIPADKTVKKSADKAVKDPSVTPVTEPSNLTDAEKAKVADEVKKSNPTVTDVKVGKDGTTTVTYPDGTTAVIPADKTVKKSADKVVTNPSVTPVTDPSNLTDTEKAKVADEVKKANPTAKDIKVNKDGSVVVTFEDGTTAVIPADKTVKKSSDKVKESDGVKNPSVTPVTDPSNLTDVEKAKVADEVKKANPTAKDIKVNNDGSVVVTFEDGSVAVIPAEKAVTAANQDSPAQAPAKKAGAKELPNTGTEQSSASLALALLAAATGGLLFAKKREEEE